MWNSSGRPEGLSSGSKLELFAFAPLGYAVFCVVFREPVAVSHNGPELDLVLDRRQVKGGEIRPPLLGLLHISLLPGYRVGALATSKSKHGVALLSCLDWIRPLLR